MHSIVMKQASLLASQEGGCTLLALQVWAFVNDSQKEIYQEVVTARARAQEAADAA